MNVQSIRSQIVGNVAAPKAQAAPPSSDNLVDRIIDKTYLSANYAASGLAGGAAGLGAYVTEGLSSAAKATGSAVKNIVKTEKYGPVLKTVAATASVVAGAVGTVLALPVSLALGVWEGTKPVDASTPRQFTVKQGIQEAYSDVGKGLDQFGKTIEGSMKELGDYKLKPGEKPIEIPLFRTAKTIALGVVGTVVGGVVGLATAVTSAVAETGKGIVDAWKDSRLNVGEKLVANATSVVGGAVHGVSYGVSSGLGIVRTAIGETWDKDSVAEGGSKLFSRAASSLKASVAPRSTLLEERPTNVSPE